MFVGSHCYRSKRNTPAFLTQFCRCLRKTFQRTVQQLIISNKSNKQLTKYFIDKKFPPDVSQSKFVVLSGNFKVKVFLFLTVISRNRQLNEPKTSRDQVSRNIDIPHRTSGDICIIEKPHDEGLKLMLSRKVVIFNLNL